MRLEPNFFAQICPHAKFEDLDKESINVFREMWLRKSGNHSLKSLFKSQLLKDGHIEGLQTFLTKKLLKKQFAIFAVNEYHEWCFGNERSLF